jgi:4-amino-4-deoxy-L-arabinose transferase-like glycosyltransferase
MQRSTDGFFYRNVHSFLLGIIVIFYLINGISSLRALSVTFDEGSFMGYSIRYLKGNPERIHPRSDNSKMPVSVLNAIPRSIQQLSGKTYTKSDLGVSDIMNGRYVTLFISVLTILLVYLWSSQLYGRNAGLFSAFLMSICPNNLAQAVLVTTDSYSVLLLLLSMYCLWRFATGRGKNWFLYFVIVAALAQLTKQSLFHLYFLAPLCLLSYQLINRQKFIWRIFQKRLALFILVQLLIINAGYYFHGTFTSLDDYVFMSHVFQDLQRALPGTMPLPFPKPFIDGLDMAKYYDQLGGGYDQVSSFGKPTIMGQERTGGGFWYYYFVSIFFKTPIAYLILFAWAKALILKSRNIREFIEKEFFLLAPVVYFLVVMSFFYKTQCGIRHIIFIYPFLFILSGIIISRIRRQGSKWLVGLLGVFLLISVVRYWKNYYPYTNEFIGDKSKAYRFVGASNLEFGQGWEFYKKHLAKHPEIKFAPREPAAGIFLIDAERYLDIWNRHEYDWIRKYEPVDHVAYNFLLIKVDTIGKGQ